MKDKETPLYLVRLWPKIAKGCYDCLDQMRGAKLDGEMYWPDYCLLPINAAYTYIIDQLNLSDEDAAMGCAELTACWTWRQNKIIYAFDADFACALADQAADVQDTDILPSELLMHLPYPCVYIKAPGVMERMDGFWAWMDYDVNRNAPELRIQWVLDTFEHSFPQVLHIIPGATLGDCVLDTVKTTLEHSKEPADISKPTEIAKHVLRALQLILYLLADNSEMEDEVKPPKMLSSRSSAKSSDVMRDKAGNVKVKMVGVRIGAAIRRSRAERNAADVSDNAGSGSAKRPHMRRGHWHHYWTGPLNGQRELILKWTAPTMIHPDQGQEDNVVIFPVK